MRVIRFIIELLFWTIAATGVMVAAGIFMGVIIAPSLGFVAAVGVIALLPLGVKIMHSIRRRRAAMTLTYLEQAVRLNLPLPQMIGAAQMSEHGVTATRLGELQTLLEEGMPIGAALATAAPEVSLRESALIDAAERVGRLPSALRRIIHEQAIESRRRNEADGIFVRAYPMVMALAVLLVTSMLLVFVMPKLQMIFKDFGTQLPPVTQSLLAVARGIGAPLLIAVVVIVLLACGMELWRMWHPIRWGDSLPRRIRDRARWATPFIGGMDRDRGLADACGVIADALDNASPLDSALAAASGLDMNTVLRARIRRWDEAVRAGRGLADSARRAGLPAIISGMLATVRGSETPDVCRFLARYFRTRFSRSAALLRGAAVPVMVFGFALLVGWVALSLIVPMTHLIDTLSSLALRF